MNQIQGAKYDSQKFKTYLDNPFVAVEGGQENIKNFKNILKLNKIVKNSFNTDITPREIKTAGAGATRHKRPNQQNSFGASFGDKEANFENLLVDGREIKMRWDETRQTTDNLDTDGNLKPRLGGKTFVQN